MELRWYNGVLQYRYKVTVTDYSSRDPEYGAFLRKSIWSEWINVPVVNEEIDNDKTS